VAQHYLVEHGPGGAQDDRNLLLDFSAVVVDLEQVALLVLGFQDLLHGLVLAALLGECEQSPPNRQHHPPRVGEELEPDLAPGLAGSEQPGLNQKVFAPVAGRGHDADGDVLEGLDDGLVRGGVLFFQSRSRPR